MLLPVLLNRCLAALKFIGGSLSDSVSVTADALNNLTDAVTSILTMRREYRLSERKRDAVHSTVSAFSKTSYTFLQNDCLERFDLECG